MKKLDKYFITIIALLITFIPLSGFLNHASVSAQGSNLCDFFPCPGETGEKEDLDEEVNSDIENYINIAVSLVFVGIIIYGIFLIISSALKIIRSEGDEGKVQEGANKIKAVYIGIAMIFVGIIGLVLITTFFGGSSIFSVNLNSPEGVNLPFVD
jgi:hypothetical protein